MPQRRPVHAVRPPLEHRTVPRWACAKKGYASREDAEAQLPRIWADPARWGGGAMEAHPYRCPRHTREVWHLTKQDPKGET